MGWLLFGWKVAMTDRLTSVLELILWLARGVSRDDVLVDLDLVADQVHAAVQLGQLRRDPFPVLAQQFEPLGLVARSGSDQLGVPTDAGQWHARSPQVRDDRHPLQLVGV